MAVAGPMFLILGVGALALNVLLVVLGLRVPNRKLEITYAMLLAALDVLVPTATIVIRSSILYSGIDLRTLPAACSAIGAFHYTTIFMSLLLVTLIAVERSCSVFSERVPAWMWRVVWCYVAFYGCLVVYASSTGLFVLAPSGSNCTLIAHHSPLSAALLVLFGGSLLAFLVVTLACYLRILRFVLNTQREHDLASMRFMPTSQREAIPKVSTAPVTVRTLLICLIYFALVFPACVLLVLLGLEAIPESLYTNLLISLMLFSICLANPAIVIFAHSLIFEQLRDLFA